MKMGFGKRFIEQPKVPVRVAIIPGYEKAELMDFFGTPFVISNRFFEMLRKAGVKNLDAYEAVLVGSNKKTLYKGFKAVNVIGKVEKADLGKADAKRPLIFRMGFSAVVIHETLKLALQAAGYDHLVFSNPLKA